MAKTFAVAVLGGIAGWFLGGALTGFFAQSTCQVDGTCAPLTQINSTIPVLIGVAVFVLIMIAGWFLSQPVRVPSDKPPISPP